MDPTIALTIASLKMFFRNRQALFFSLLLPFLIMSIFGVLRFDAFSSVDLGIVDEARNEASAALVQGLERTGVLDISQGSREDQMKALEDGDLDYVVVLPPDFGASTGARVEGYYSAARPQEAQVAGTVLARMLDELTFQVTGTQRLFHLSQQEVNARDLGYVDFLVPGIIAMSIMQMGIFSVTFAVVQFRQQGVLRRLRAAPISPGHFLAGQVITRLVVSLLQTAVLLTAGVFLLGVDVRGDFLTLGLLAILGGGLFISIGYAVSGFARTEEVAAPVANLIALPMMFMSGVFFPRDSLPGFLEVITRYFPLTYLADGMRQVTTEGSGLLDVSGDVAGLAVWLLVGFLAAIRMFRWE